MAAHICMCTRNVSLGFRAQTRRLLTNGGQQVIVRVVSFSESRNLEEKKNFGCLFVASATTA